MKIQFEIQRQENAQSKPYIQRICYESDNPNETVATALLAINHSGLYKDEAGNPVGTITWEAGCLQKKCGACAMLINGKPALACDTFLKDMEKKKYITLEPLRKFPVIRDLATDRSIMLDNLKELSLWAGVDGAAIKEKELDRAYDAARCLQCGCCLEACPNFYPGGSFFSAAGFAPQARLLSSYTGEERKQIQKLYKEHIYNGCGKSLACSKVCPAHIDLDRLLSRSNAISVWRKSS